MPLSRRVFAESIHEARAGGKETDVALRRDKLAAGRQKCGSVDAVLAVDDIVALAELNSTL